MFLNEYSYIADDNFSEVNLSLCFCVSLCVNCVLADKSKTI